MTSNENLLQACSLEETGPVTAVVEAESAVVSAAAETFKFKIPEVMEESEENLLENVLRRQSLFKLKEKINGKVSKQINEIERRKLSPYRFSNSPLKAKRAKEHTSGLAKSGLAKRTELPVSKLTEIPEEQYVMRSSAATAVGGGDVKSPFSRGFGKKMENSCVSSPTMVRVAGLANKFFYKKFSKSRNVKRLNATTTAGSPYSNGAEETENRNPNMSLQNASSPAGKRLVSAWKAANESVDL